MKLKFQPTDDQQFCIGVLSEFAGGDHHLPKIEDWGHGVAINHSGDLSTHDFDGLTRLVLLAHKHAVRIEISFSGPGRVKIIAHRRKHQGDGERLGQSVRHPSLADLAAKIELLK